MAIVTSLQFSSNSGAMICDEEYWFLRRRRSFFLDNFRNVIPDKVSEALGIEAAYGGWGHPGFHEEVIRRTQEEIQSLFDAGPGDKPENYPLYDLEKIALIVRKAMQDTRRRKVDDMLRYLYGFNLDDLNRGSFTENGKTYEIKQSAVSSAARDIATFKTQNNLTNPIFKNKAVLIGFDPTYKFRGFHLNAENTVCSLISGGFEAIGAGLYGAGIEFSRLMNRLTLDQRRSGFDRVWGMIALFEATLNAYDHFHEVGGGLNLVFIDGQGKTHADRYHEFHDDISQLAMEMVKTYRHQLISAEKLYPLIENLLYKGTDVKVVETEFFQSCTDLETVKKLMRGYKLPPFPEPPAPSKKKGKGATK